MSLAVLFGLAETADPARRGVFGQLAAWAPSVIVAAVLIFGGIAFARLDLPRVQPHQRVRRDRATPSRTWC